MSTCSQEKKRRGRPRKKQDNCDNILDDPDNKASRDLQKFKIFSKKTETPQQKLVLCLQDSDSDSDDYNNGDGDCGRKKVESSHHSEYNESEFENKDYDSDNDQDVIQPVDYSKFNTKDHDVLILLKQIRRRDALISKLSNIPNVKKSTSSKIDPFSNLKGFARSKNIGYHCPLFDVNTEKEFIPKKNNIDCWWCDYGFDNIPAYIPQYYRDKKYYVFGNFCSFNCAFRYNNQMKDSKVEKRDVLLKNLKNHCLGEDEEIRMAGDREILKKKGGPMEIEEFRACFHTDVPVMDMPPMIPMMHVIKHQ